jgi:hypothetical protein
MLPKFLEKTETQTRTESEMIYFSFQPWVTSHVTNALQKTEPEMILLSLSAMGYISCYQCSSKNRTELNCEDPMSSAALPITKNCMVPKENHVGNFPANYCVKMIGTSSKLQLLVYPNVLDN